MFNICLVVTKPDRPSGRGHKVIYSPVKEFALRNGLKLFQPNDFEDNETIGYIKSLVPDIIAVVAYGKILSREVLEIPKLGCVNLHYSFLPELRGAAPIQAAIVRGIKTTGVTTIFMDEGVDTGDILFSEEVEIDMNETAGELSFRLSEIGARLLVTTLSKIEALHGAYAYRKKQNNSKATYCSLVEKNDAQINWSECSYKIRDLVRGMNPDPTAFTFCEGKKIKIFDSKILRSRGGFPGQVIKESPLLVSCGNGTSLEILELQLEGRKRMKAEDFVRGFSLKGKKFEFII
jgi:methionyl-tRNA formyltransferase